MGLTLQRQGKEGKWRIINQATMALALDERGNYVDKGGYHSKSFAQLQMGRLSRFSHVKLNQNTIK